MSTYLHATRDAAGNYSPSTTILRTLRPPRTHCGVPQRILELVVIGTVTNVSALVTSRPRLRNSELGYGLVTKSLHWLTVLALLTQFAVGYWMTNVDEVLEPLRSGGDRGDDDAGGLALLPIHIGLGLGIMGLAAIRLVWRLTTPLPPWAEQLSAVERKVATTVERVFYALLFVIPASGLALVLFSGEDWELSGDREYRAPLELIDHDILLGLHITSHVIFFAALAVHLTLVAKNRLLRRML